MLFKVRALIFLLSFFSLSAHAKNYWNRIVIPEAFCGNGKPYHVFFKEKDKSKLLITFVSGGACWSKSTCFGPNLRTWIRPRYKDPKTPIFARNEKFENHSVLFLPYCTGDVFAGRHVAQYEKKQMYHYGALNVERSLKYLSRHRFIRFNKVKDLVLYGSSAGGIGAFIHSKKVGRLVSSNAKKTIVADSPGLHFGEEFWNKFTFEQIADFRHAFERVKFNAPLDDGFVAPYLKNTCRYLRDWDIAVLMGSKDMVMSRIFGNISMTEHENLVYSVNGIAETFKYSTNCSVWLKRSKVHTFLLGAINSSNDEVNGISALQFIRQVHSSRSHDSIIEDKLD